MTHDESTQVNQLQAQLDTAHRNAEQSRARLSSALDRSNDEARLYRGLFWLLLAISGSVAVLSLLSR